MRKYLENLRVRGGVFNVIGFLPVKSSFCSAMISPLPRGLQKINLFVENIHM